MAGENGWNEWSKHVLSELVRHSKGQDDINKKVDRIETKIDGLPCPVYHERLKWMQLSIKVLWIALSCITISGVVLGIWVKAVMAGT